MQLTEYDLEWTLPPERGWAYIHTADILAGSRTRWPIPSHNPDHQEREKIRTWSRSVTHHSTTPSLHPSIPPATH